MKHDPVITNAIAESSLTEVERALLVLFTQEDQLNPMAVPEISAVIEEAGHAKINQSRLRGKLEKDPRCSKYAGGFRIRANQRAKVADLAGRLISQSRPRVIQAWLDPQLLSSGPKYVREILDQINRSYESHCFDACAVMVRRLVETLLVEAFERSGALREITDANGDIVTLKHLIERARKSKAFTISRQTKNALPQIKNIGDWSAHNRRFLAKRSDLDRAHDPLRLSLADLGHIAGMA